LDKWKELKKLIEWKITIFESNPDPTGWDKIENGCNKHFLKEMKRIEDGKFDETGEIRVKE
jgi:hypothetical protein